MEEKFPSNSTSPNSSSLPPPVLDSSLLEELDRVHVIEIEILLILIYSLLTICGFAANAIIIRIIVKSKQLLQNPNNVLVLNLMISGLLMSIFCIPITMYSVIRYSWSFGLALCKIIPSIQSCSILVCSSTIATISIDRYVRVTNKYPVNFDNPFQARKHWKTLIQETTIIWFLSALASSPFPTFQTLALNQDQVTWKCVEHWPSHSAKSITSLIYVAIQFVLPCVILMVTSIKINRYLDRSTRFQDNQEFPLEPINNERTSTKTIVMNVDQVNTVAVSSSPSPRRVGSAGSANRSSEQLESRYNSHEIMRNKQVTRTLVAITASFCILWLPWNIFNALLDHNITFGLSKPSLYLAFSLTHIIAMISVPLNAFLYGWSNPMIKVQVLALFGRPPRN